jgi:pSer/pThr/pTyr-binding forkhead associated (FHA) protein
MRLGDFARALTDLGETEFRRQYDCVVLVGSGETDRSALLSTSPPGMLDALVNRVPQFRAETPAFLLRRKPAQDSLTLGRDEASDVCIRIGQVSRAHAIVRFAESGAIISIADAGSLHGTFLDGAAIYPQKPKQWAAGEFAGHMLTLGSVHFTILTPDQFVRTLRTLSP